MNTTATQNLSRLTTFAALAVMTAAAIVLPTTSAQATPKAEVPVIVQLPRVVITGQRADRSAAAPMKIVDLPRVVITVRRAEATRLVQAAAARPI